MNNEGGVSAIKMLLLEGSSCASSLMEIRAFGQQNNFWFKREVRSDEMKNKRLGMHPLIFDPFAQICADQRIVGQNSAKRGNILVFFGLICMRTW